MRTRSLRYPQEGQRRGVAVNSVTGQPIERSSGVAMYDTGPMPAAADDEAPDCLACATVTPALYGAGAGLLLGVLFGAPVRTALIGAGAGAGVGALRYRAAQS